MENGQQIFQANSSLRWKSIKWTGRIMLFVLLFFLSVLILALVRGFKPSLPNLHVKSKEYQDKLDPTNPFTFSHSQNKKIKGFKDFLARKENGNYNLTPKPLNDESGLIRAAFYTPWTSTTSLPDLVAHGSQINTIIPEWFFIDPATHRLQSRIDSAGLTTMRKKGLRILPMLSNFNSEKKDFDGSLVHDILHNPDFKKNLLRQISDTLAFYQFQGINIDFEELSEKNNQFLSDFQHDLYNSLHPKGYWVTMDLTPDNEDYDKKRLSECNDYIILMAYDQYNLSTGPGPVCEQKWIEASLDKTARDIPPEKIILGLAAYGYDWANGKPYNTYTYQDALNKARVANAVIDYDNDTYNLHFNYTEEEEDEQDGPIKTNHQVWFTDAATLFNVLRFNDEYGTAGSALWRLGSEDNRIWSFYHRRLDHESLDKKAFDFNSFKKIPALTNNIGFTGEGEVLRILFTPQEGHINLEIDTADLLIAEQRYEKLPSGYVIQKYAEDTTVGKGHKLILTFDDGPSDVYTPMVLDILEKEKVPASFFVVGLEAEKNIPLLKRIYRDGFEIGNHTFTHNNLATMSPQRALVEMKLTRLLIECVTGRSTILFRAPYNADSEPHTYEELEPIARSRKENYLTIGESIDPMDWQPGVNADSIFNRVVRQVEDRNASIILLHDAGGKTRQATVDALPRIIHYFRDKGYVFTSIADLMHQTHAEVMPPVPPSKDGWLIKLNFMLAEGTYWAGHFLFALFIIGIVLSLARMIAMGVLAYLQKRKSPVISSHQPGVSIIVPAYNEEVNAVKTVQSLLKQDYPDFEIIFVDDGSKDNTFQLVKEAFENNPRVQVVKKPNGGKASALNEGIRLSKNDWVVCIDADSQLNRQALSELMKYFSEEEGKEPVGAVAGHVKVGNDRNMLTRWQNIEYITSQNFDRNAFAYLNAITVVPGAIGAFSKKAILDAGSFTTDTLAEDCDLTMRLQKAGYRILNCTTAISYTEAPETIRQFLKQRFRWSFGIMQSFWKHRDALFNPRYKNFGMVALPNILLFQIILPFLAPLADLVLLLSMLAVAFGLIPAGTNHILIYYLVFTLVDIAGAAMAFSFENSQRVKGEKESYVKLLWLVPQRLVYRQLMYYILIKSATRALKGELQGWGVLKRTGHVKQPSIA